MGVEDLGGLADFATEASAVASNIIENGKEFLSDGFNQLQEQVSTFAGDSSWFDSNFIGDIVPADVTTLTKSFNFDSLSSFTSEFPSLSSITSNYSVYRQSYFWSTKPVIKFSKPLKDFTKPEVVLPTVWSSRCRTQQSAWQPTQ
jgi:hypothetical protein